MAIVADHQATKVVQPGPEPLHLPSSTVSAQQSAILCAADRAGRRQLDWRSALSADLQRLLCWAIAGYKSPMRTTNHLDATHGNGQSGDGPAGDVIRHAPALDPQARTGPPDPLLPGLLPMTSARVWLICTPSEPSALLAMRLTVAQRSHTVPTVRDAHMIKKLHIHTAICLMALACHRTPSITNPETPLILYSATLPVTPGTESFKVPDSNLTILIERDRGVSDIHIDRLHKAFEVTTKLINSSKFHERLLVEPKWFAAVDNKDSLSSQNIFEAYPRRIPQTFLVHITPRDQAGLERAGTTCNPPRINLYTNIIDEWDGSQDRPEPSLINTLAHEMTHLILQKQKNLEDYAFTDAGFSLHPCKQADLVSYKIGNIADCVYRNLSDEKFQGCMKDRNKEIKKRIWAICPARN